MSDFSSSLRSEAREAFDALLQLFGESRTYWRLGNSFDTLIDYCIIDRTVCGDLMDRGWAKYNAMGGPSWFDDYGWWGIAAAKASTIKEFITPGLFTGIMRTCWEKMQPGATVWDRAEKSVYADFEPRFPGGIRERQTERHRRRRAHG